MVADRESGYESKSARPPLVPGKLEELSKPTTRTHRLLLRGKPIDLPVFEIPVKYLYFSIENGRYADRMIKLKAETPNIVIDPRSSVWIKKIQDMLMGRGKLANPRDKNDSKQLLEDIKEKTQIVPGIVAHDGGVLDGNRRLAVLMELGKEYFDGVILPENVSSEDKWRIEAGLQMGKPIVLQYSPMNELLKIRQGIELFRLMKKEGTDPAPNKTPEDLVAETLYGRDRKEIDEMTRRLRLIEEYLDWLKKPGRFDIVGDRAERFKEVLVMIEDAKKPDMSPKQYGDLKAMVFANVFSKNIDNWDLRELRKAVPGSSGSGRPMSKSKKASKKLMENLPDAEMLRKECTDVMRGEEYSDELLERKLQSRESELRKATDLANVVVDIVREEDKSPDPNRLLGEAVDRLESVLELIPSARDKAVRNRLEEQLRIVSSMVDRAFGMLKKGSH
jgi:hypothetical protein